jgi:hypothetical protein
MFYSIELDWKVKVSRPYALTERNAMKEFWDSEGIAPRILDLGTRWS